MIPCNILSYNVLHIMGITESRPRSYHKHHNHNHNHKHRNHKHHNHKHHNHNHNHKHHNHNSNDDYLGKTSATYNQENNYQNYYCICPTNSNSCKSYNHQCICSTDSYSCKSDNHPCVCATSSNCRHSGSVAGHQCVCHFKHPLACIAYQPHSCCCNRGYSEFCKAYAGKHHR